jgi:hypothetical protein
MINLSDNMIATAKRNISGEFGFPLGLTPISSPLHPDSLVKFGTSAGDSTNNLLELRVLSTYRTTVRIRDVTYQDTMVDRYLNRRRSGATSKSVEQNGHFGGNDFLLDSTLNTWSTILGTHTPRELMYNDIGLPVPGFTAMGYLESRSASHGIYVHLRPQDRGDVALAWRRARMSFDGQPPSAFENQANLYGADYLPLDYVHSGQNELLDNLFRRARRTQRRDNFCLSVEHVVQKYEEERGGLWTGQMG